MTQDSLVVAGKNYSSRLLVGTGKYKDEAEAISSIEASGAEIVTVAVRRIDLQNDKDSSILDYISPDIYTILPNTAGAYSTKDAVRMAKLGREILGGKNLLKLEVLDDPKTLLPNMDSTLEAAEILVRDGFEVMAYCTADYESCMKLEDIGCVSIMPLAALLALAKVLLNLKKFKKL